MPKDYAIACVLGTHQAVRGRDARSFSANAKGLARSEELAAGCLGCRERQRKPRDSNEPARPTILRGKPSGLRANATG